MLFLVPVKYRNYRFGIINLVCVFWQHHLHSGAWSAYLKGEWGLQQLAKRKREHAILSKMGVGNKVKGEVPDFFTVLSTKLI